jgi:hypothetical protein
MPLAPQSVTVGTRRWGAPEACLWCDRDSCCLCGSARLHFSPYTDSRWLRPPRSPGPIRLDPPGAESQDGPRLPRRGSFPSPGCPARAAPYAPVAELTDSSWWARVSRSLMPKSSRRPVTVSTRRRLGPALTTTNRLSRRISHSHSRSFAEAGPVHSRATCPQGGAEPVERFRLRARRWVPNPPAVPVEPRCQPAPPSVPDRTCRWS